MPNFTKKKAPGWGIWDLEDGRLYIQRTYRTKSEAEQILRDLLQPYPHGHEWRRRLGVKAYNLQLGTKGDPSTQPEESLVHHGSEGIGPESIRLAGDSFLGASSEDTYVLDLDRARERKEELRTYPGAEVP